MKNSKCPGAQGDKISLDSHHRAESDFAPVWGTSLGAVSYSAPWVGSALGVGPCLPAPRKVQSHRGAAHAAVIVPGETPPALKQPVTLTKLGDRF